MSYQAVYEVLEPVSIAGRLWPRGSLAREADLSIRLPRLLAAAQVRLVGHVLGWP